MTLRVEIHEQPERRRFWAEVEVGGMIARRREVTSPMEDGIDGILAVVRATYGEMVPQQKRPPPPPLPAEAAITENDPLDALRAEAEALGVRVDGRWGEARLREEIAAAAGDYDDAGSVGAEHE